LEKVILIVSTDATRTGTPVLLLNTLKWLKKNSDLKFILLLNHGGELINEFRDLCNTYIWPDYFPLAGKIKSKKAIFRFLRRILLSIQNLACFLFVRKLRSRYSIRLIYSNSARNGEILSFLGKKLNEKIVLHVHEGGRTLDLFDNKGFVKSIIERSDLIIAVSDAVKQTLKDKYNPLQKIVVIPGGIETDYVFKAESRLLLNQEGISDDKVIVMSCGWLDWHKGTDAFIQISRYLSSQNDKLHFVWLGGQAKDPEYEHMKFDIEKLNLSNRITIITSKPNSPDYINCADIFLMLSREESFSLVTLEAGLAKKPVLCFDKSGGPLEIVNHDPRFIVPYGDIFTMCERIREILENESLHKQMSDYLYSRVINSYSIEKSASSILEVINMELAKI
jgi:glycosyltransferase involved in cell wall biosynthesis